MNAPGIWQFCVRLLRRHLLLAVRRPIDIGNPLLFFAMVVALFPLGLGPAPAYSDKLMNDVTDAGRGAYVYLDSVEEADKVLGLEMGADDYITKPFDVPELLARLQAIQRRAADTSVDPVFTAGPLMIDLESRIVQVNHKEISLSSTEYALLRILAQHLGKVITHKQLLREVWGTAAEDRSQYLRVYMTHLRKKIEGPAGKRMIKTEVGIGYRLFA